MKKLLLCLMILHLGVAWGSVQGHKVRSYLRQLCVHVKNGTFTDSKSPLLLMNQMGVLPDDLEHFAVDALLLAAELGYVEAVAKLAGEKTTAAELNTALVLAAAAGHLDVVEELIVAGADDLHAALLHAMRENRSEVAQRLLDLDASLDEALQLAVLGGHSLVLERLAARGASAFDRMLPYAALGVGGEMVEHLVALGATLDRALLWAEQAGLVETVAKLRRLEQDE